MASPEASRRPVSRATSPADSIHLVRLRTGPIGIRHWARTIFAASAGVVSSGSNVGM